jgi:glycosyltransferase involved in cell wall biosynthesis
MAPEKREHEVRGETAPPSSAPGLPLLVFADDWGRHPSSCQHLVSRLLGRHPVVWVNTIGTRKPRLDLDTLHRGFEKLKHWTRRPEGQNSVLPANLRVLNPRMWPAFDSRLARWLNRRLLEPPLATAARQFEMTPVAVTTIPLVADLVGALPVCRWVYYCVDDFSTWPGLDGGTLRQMEKELVRQVDVLIAVSENLQDRLAAMGRPTHLLTHGVDTGFWTAPTPGSGVPELEKLEKPLVVFWGVLDRRMDISFLSRLSKVMERGTIALVGPQADPDPELARLPRTVRPGSLPFEQLPALARESAVLVMPYADLPVTRAMQPLKLKEYLATGKPVVVRDLPATRPWGDCLDLVSSPDEFAAAVTRRLAEGVPEAQRLARQRLVDEGWEAKARSFERWLCEP